MFATEAHKKHLWKKYSKIFKVLLFAPLIIYCGERSPIAFDEGYYILQSKWILLTDDWISPMYWGDLNLDRTIGVQFLIALSQKIFGKNDIAIYFPTFLAGIIMLISTAEIHKYLIHKKNQIISLLILSTTFLWINYFHMATQDIIFASIINVGILVTIKAYKTKKDFYFFFSGFWIGLAFMLKTYLVAIPFLAILPFLIKTKIIRNKLFWIGTFIGFSPFLIWGYKIILNYGLENFSGLYSKLLILSKNNNFTNPFYYYLWNLPINTLPWSIFSLIGFLNLLKSKNKISYYFLFQYPLFIMILLSIFSTKTPYYPIQILPIISINAYLGLIFVLKNKNIFSTIFNKLVFTVFPLILLLLLLYLNFHNQFFNIENSLKLILIISLSLSLTSWFLAGQVRYLKNKLLLIILGPYFLISTIVQKGFLNDRSKDLRIASEEIIEKEKLYNKKVEFIKTGPRDEEASSKLIRIAIFMPNIGEGLNSMEELKRNQYAWTTIPNQEIITQNEFEIVSESEILFPWKLIIKK